MTTALNIVRDYIVSTTYRKHEQRGANWGAWRASAFAGPAPAPVARRRRALEELDQGGSPNGPERRPLRALDVDGWHLPAAVPAALGPLSALGSGPARARQNALSASDKLATILRMAVTPLRWEPLNPSGQHRGIPSPSSLFLAELFILARAADGAVVARRYLPHSHLLAEHACTPQAQEVLGEAPFAFVIVGHLSRCVTPYGEFSPCITSLEAGHLQAQLATLCAALGWQTRTDGCVADAGVGTALGLAHWSAVPMALVRVEDGEAAHALPAGPSVRARVADLDAQVADTEHYARLKRLIDALAGEPGPAHRRRERRPVQRAAVAGEVPPALTLRDIIERRSSGSNDGLAPLARHLEHADLAKLVAVTHQLHALDADTDLADVGISITLSVQHGAQGVDGGYRVDLADGSLARMVDAPGAHARTRNSVAARERSLVITLAVDDVRELRRWGARSFVLSHLAAGALGQKLCLAAAACGMSARPIRAYADFLVDTALPLEQRSIYQIICCFERGGGPSFDLV